jgi:arylformamidase
MTTIYRDMDQAALNAAYNNSAGVPDSSAMMDAFIARSDALRATHPDYLELRYGPKERNRIDYFAAGKPGPLLVFVHGGYWQMRAKENFSFLAEGALARGMHVAMIGYTLAPDIGITGIVDEVKAALAFIRDNLGQYGANVDAMILSGWSAGGHLTAMCLDEPGVAAGVAISGIYDLTPVRLIYVNDKLKLTDDDIAQASPALLPLSKSPLVLTYGLSELAGLKTQTEEFAERRKALPGTFLPLAGHNHFTIMDEMASVDGAIAKEIFKLAGI